MIRERVVYWVRKLARSFGYDLVKTRRRPNDGKSPYGPVYPGATYSPWINDPNFEDVFQRYSPNSLVDRYRSYELWELVAQSLKVGGDIVEVGVWRGGSGLLIAERSRQLGSDRRIFLCDTFEGIVKSGVHDNRVRNGMYADTSEEAVRDLVVSAELENVVVIKGTFPEDATEELKNARFGLCHIDVDTYQSCKDSVEWLWPKLEPSGIMVFDDYGFSGTAGIATYLDAIKGDPACEFLHNLNGHGIIIKRLEDIPSPTKA